MFLFFQFSLGRGTHADDRHTAGKFGQAFLQFFAVIITGGLVNLHANLLNAPFDLGFVALATDDSGIVFVRYDLFGAAEVRQHNRLELAAGLLGDHRGASQEGDVLQHSLAAVTKTGGFDRQHVEHAAQFVHHQQCQGFAIYIFGNDHQVAFAGLHQFLQDGHEVLGCGDFLVVDEDVRFRDH